MRYLLLIVLLGLLLIAPAITAQEAEDPADEARAVELLATTQALVATTEARLDSLEDTAGRVEGAADLAFNLLGLFEAIGFFVTVAAGIAALFGIPRFISAQNELQEARKLFEDEITTSRERLEKDTAQKEAELNALRSELKDSTGKATLALSFLPLGDRQYKAGDFKGAMELFKRALELDRNNPIIHYRLGYVYTQAGQLDDAERHLKLALDIEKDFAPALAVLGYTYRRMAERMDEGHERDMLQNQAEQLLQRALALSPRLVDDDGESWWGSLGGLYRRRGQIDQAIRAYTQAGEVTPNSSYAFSNLALLYMQQGNRNKMIETYRKVEELAIGEVQSDPDNYWANADLLTSRLALDKYEEAQKALQGLFVTAPLDSSWALDSQMDTMSRLALALEPEKAAIVREFIERIRQFAEEARRKHEETIEKETQTRMKTVQVSSDPVGD